MILYNGKDICFGWWKYGGCRVFFGVFVILVKLVFVRFLN